MFSRSFHFFQFTGSVEGDTHQQRSRQALVMAFIAFGREVAKWKHLEGENLAMKHIKKKPVLKVPDEIYSNDIQQSADELLRIRLIP